MTDSLEKAREAFYTGPRSEATPFLLNDTVTLVGGDAEGCDGYLISVEGVNPLVYLLERGDGGGDILVRASDLELIVGC